MTHILQPFTKFSESILWKLQEEMYKRSGPGAWSEKGVPFYVTSNSWTAFAYAQMVKAFFRDLAQNKMKGPVYLFDLGAGSGRLAYLFLKNWTRWQSQNDSPLKLRYILTDIAESNLNFLMNHPLLKPYIEQGILDCTFFNALQEEETLHLRISNEKINRLQNPIILIANYFFDTIPQELYQVKAGKLYQGLIELSSEQPISDSLDPKLITQVAYDFRYEPIQSLESPWKKLIEEHAKEMKNATFLFPSGALKSIQFFQRVANGPLMLLAQDQAIMSANRWSEQKNPTFSLHTSFSLLVSYYTLMRYFEKAGGKAWIPTCPSETLCTLAALLDPEGRKWDETKEAYANHIAWLDPWAYSRIAKHWEAKIDNLGDIIQLIRLGRCDPIVLYVHYDKIALWIPFASPPEKRDLLATIFEAAEEFYPIGANDADFLMDLGVLCTQLKAFEESLSLYMKAGKLGCKHPNLVQNILFSEISLARS